MKRKIVYGIVLIAFLTGILTLQTSIQPAKAPDGFGYIYIKADGSIDPPDAPISKDAENVTYSLTADIVNKSIIIQRDNIILNGNNCRISGPTVDLDGIENSIGINVTNRYNVTIKDTNVEKFDKGIYVFYSTKITICGNNASNNKMFVYVDEFIYYLAGTGISVSRSNETLIFNNTVSNNIWGIGIYQSNSTHVDSNNVYDNRERDPIEETWQGTGISLSNSKNITVTNNTVSNNARFGISILSDIETTVDTTIRNNTISGHYEESYSYGLFVSRSHNNTIIENNIAGNIYGVYVCTNSQNQTIINNNVSSNAYGIYLDKSTNNTIINNTLFKNGDAIRFENSANHNKILFNTVLNSSSFGIYIRSDSRNNLLVGNTVTNNSWGIRFTQSNNNTIFGNTVSLNTYDGLVIYYYSSNNEVMGNNITLSGRYGIIITYGCYNTKIFHNNFIDNTQHVFTDMNSTWDNGYPSGGNYWSNYTGADIKWGPDQNETGSDGIGDTVHMVNENNTDRYPLMAPINIFDAGIWDTTSYHVDIISNSTVSNFKIDTVEKVISFNVIGETGFGFCRVIIPNIIINTLWLNNYVVLVNGLPVEFRNWTDSENTYIYFAYPHSEKTITIIPEFQPATLLTLLMLSAASAIILKKFSKNLS
jgi:parallel beta-helix repeat protein